MSIEHSIENKTSYSVKAFVFFLAASFPGLLQAQTPARHTYAIKESDTLWMDQYKPSAKPNGISVIFVHGGAFTGGDPVNQKPMADGLTKLGYQVFVIKYRLYLRGKSFGCETTTPEKLKAVRYAVEDAADATKYVVQNAAALKVDTTKIFIAGSSAGAEAILNLVYNPFIGRGDKTYQPFPYAGALSFAGAVLDINPVLNRTPIPLFLMHGTNDQLVPYGTSPHRFCKAADAGWMIMFGARTLYAELQKKNSPVVLYTYEGLGHEVANYMFRRFKEMDDFMKTVAQKGTIVPANIVIKK